MVPTSRRALLPPIARPRSDCSRPGELRTDNTHGRTSTAAWYGSVWRLGNQGRSRTKIEVGATERQNAAGRFVMPRAIHTLARTPLLRSLERTTVLLLPKETSAAIAPTLRDEVPPRRQPPAPALALALHKQSPAAASPRRKGRRRWWWQQQRMAAGQERRMHPSPRSCLPYSPLIGRPFTTMPHAWAST